MDSADKHLQDKGFTLTIITRTNSFTGINITWTDGFTWADVNLANKFTWKNSSCKIIGLLGRTLFNHTGLLGRICLLGYTLLEQKLPSQTLGRIRLRFMRERALTSLE